MLQDPKSGSDLVAMLAALGVAIATGKILASGEKTTWRKVLGSSIAHAGLAAGATAILIWFPNASPAAVVGLGVFIATLGVKGLQNLIAAWRGKK